MPGVTPLWGVGPKVFIRATGIEKLANNGLKLEKTAPPPSCPDRL